MVTFKEGDKKELINIYKTLMSVPSRRRKGAWQKNKMAKRGAA